MASLIKEMSTHSVRAGMFFYIENIRFQVLRPEDRKRKEWVVTRGGFNPTCTKNNLGFKPVRMVMSTEQILDYNADSAAARAHNEIIKSCSDLSVKKAGRKFFLQKETE